MVEEHSERHFNKEASISYQNWLDGESHFIEGIQQKNTCMIIRSPVQLSD